MGLEMKSTRIFITSILILVLGCFVQAHADLKLIGQGTSVHGTYNLIYDTDLDITWYDYTNADNTWQNQVNWAAALSVNFGGNIYDDWRLPTTFYQSCVGHNCTNSEMGHLFYTKLRNKGTYDISGDPTSCYGRSCLTKAGPFQNLQPSHYWAGTEYAAYTGNAWNFNFDGGSQNNGDKGNRRYALAVRPGLAVVLSRSAQSYLLLVEQIWDSGDSSEENLCEY